MFVPSLPVVALVAPAPFVPVVVFVVLEPFVPVVVFVDLEPFVPDHWDFVVARWVYLPDLTVAP